jgi:hypothetical protein
VKKNFPLKIDIFYYLKNLYFLGVYMFTIIQKNVQYIELIFLPCIQAAKLFLIKKIWALYLYCGNSYEAEKMWYFWGKGAILIAPTVFAHLGRKGNLSAFNKLILLF